MTAYGYTRTMSSAPDDLATLLKLLLRHEAAAYGWPRVRVLTAAEAGLPKSASGTVYLLVDDETTGQGFVIGIRERAQRPAPPDGRPG